MIEVILPDDSKRFVILAETNDSQQRDQLWQLLREIRDGGTVKIFLTQGLPLGLPALTLVMNVRESHMLPVSPTATEREAFEGTVRYALPPPLKHMYDNVMPEI